MKIFDRDIEAIIFDLDGVIVDTAKYHYLAWKRLAAEVGIELSLEDNERLKGVSRMDSLNIILSLKGISLPEGKKLEMTERKNQWFVEYIRKMDAADILPGAKELIVYLKSIGLKIALGSSSKNAATVLSILNLKHLFDVIVDGTMTKNSKPHPEIFLTAATQLRIAPAQCVVFEDAAAGVDAALSAGMLCIGVGPTDQLGKADIVVDNLINFSLENITENKSHI